MGAGLELEPRNALKCNAPAFLQAPDAFPPVTPAPPLSRLISTSTYVIPATPPRDHFLIDTSYD
jgi:hypothetical protein